MGKNFFYLLVILSISFSSALAKQKAPPSQRVMIMGITADKLDESVINTLLGVITEEINKHPNYNAVSRNEIMNMLEAEQEKLALNCSDNSCLIEIAGAMGAEKIISGSIGRLENSLICNLQILNTSRAIVEARVNYSWKGKLSDLSELVRVASQSLILTKKEQKPSKVVISRAPKGAKILVDGRKKGKIPTEIKGLILGPHKLVLQKKGYLDFETYFLSKNGETAILEAPMIKQKKPIYEQWWFWTGIGVAVLGTVGTLVLLKDDPASSSGSKVDNSITATFPQTPSEITGLGFH